MFFLVPSVASSFLLGDVQSRIFENMDNREVLNGIFQAEMGKILIVSLLSMIAGFVGYLSVLVLLTDRSRPTVGEAIMRGLRCLPTVLAATVIGYFAMLFCIILISVIGGILSAVLGGAGVALVFIAILALVLTAVARFSMTFPVVVVENTLNPIAALQRSWRLTRGNAFRLLGFYVLLFIAYVVITVLLMVVIGAATGIAGGGEPGEATLMFTSVLAGAIGAVVGVIASAVLAYSAEEGRLDPVIGRDAEIRRVIQVLSRRTKNNPVLIGDPGVGKTAVVEGLAQRIVDGDVPDSLKGRRLLSLDLAAMVAGASFQAAPIGARSSIYEADTQLFGCRQDFSIWSAR